MATKRVLNDTAGVKTYVDQEVQPGAYYTIGVMEELRWIEEANTVGTLLRTDLDSCDAKMNDGTSDYTVPSEGLDFLRAMDAGCIRAVLVDDSNKSVDKKYMKYNNNSKKIEYVDPLNEVALDYDGEILYDYDFNLITIDEDI